MVVQPPQTRVCLRCQSLEASSRTAPLRVEIARLNAAPRKRHQIGLGHGFAIIPKRSRTATEDKSHETSGASNSKLGIVKDRLWPVIRGLRC
jgi:hypothetical protein